MNRYPRISTMSGGLDQRSGQHHFYGWRIVAVTFLTLFVSVGFGFYSFGPFFKALADEFGGSRLGVGLGLSLFFLTNGLLAPSISKALTKGNIKRLMSIGVVLLASGFLVVSFVRSLPQFYLVLGSLMAVGSALIGGLVASTLVANWFVRQRGMALGIATMGISLSGVIMAPLATALIANLGWRSTFQIYSALTLLLVLPAVRLVVIDQPEDIGQYPDGDDEPDEPEQPTAPMTWNSALRNVNFWIIALAVSLSMCANGAILTHIIPHVTDLGHSAARGAVILSLIASFGVLGKVLFGWISDNLDKRAAMWLSTGLQGAAVILMTTGSAFSLLLVAGAIFGLGMGGLVPLWGTLIGASFGRRLFGRVMGLMSPVMLPLQTLGVPLAGWIFDAQGSYLLAFQIFVAGYVLSMLLLVFLKLPTVEPGRAMRGQATFPV